MLISHIFKEKGEWWQAIRRIAGKKSMETNYKIGKMQMLIASESMQVGNAMIQKNLDEWSWRKHKPVLERV